MGSTPLFVGAATQVDAWILTELRPSPKNVGVRLDPLPVATTTLTGTTGNDILNAPGSVTTLVAGYQGNDTITLVLDQDEARGGKGADSITLQASTTRNTVNAGAGNDSLFLTTAVTKYDGNTLFGDGDDYLVTTTKIQTIGGIIGGNAGSDTISLLGGQLNTEVGGGAGGDKLTLKGGATNLTLQGGKGADTIQVDGSASLSTVAGGDGHDRMLLSANVGSTTFVASGGKGADSIRLGSGLFASIAGGGLADTINLRANFAGGVIFTDGLGTTTAGTGTEGAADGADLVNFSAGQIAGATTIYGGGGADTIKLNDTAAKAAAKVVIDGGNGADHR